MTVPNIPAMM
jgi:hypothetical protein